jgi:hypothetical protein
LQVADSAVLFLHYGKQRHQTRKEKAKAAEKERLGGLEQEQPLIKEGLKTDLPKGLSVFYLSFIRGFVFCGAIS